MLTLLLELHGRSVIEGRMLAPSVIKHLDILKNLVLGLLARLEPPVKTDVAE
jgi:hypothetical protein